MSFTYTYLATIFQRIGEVHNDKYWKGTHQTLDKTIQRRGEELFSKIKHLMVNYDC
jgi:hypothetical protein